MLAVSQTVAALFLMCYTLGKANLILALLECVDEQECIMLPEQCMCTKKGYIRYVGKKIKQYYISNVFSNSNFAHRF